MQNVWRDGKLCPFVLLSFSGTIAYISYGRFTLIVRRKTDTAKKEISGTKIILKGTVFVIKKKHSKNSG